MGGAAQSNHSMSFDHLTSLRDEDTNTLKVCASSNCFFRRIVGHSWGPHNWFHTYFTDGALVNIMLSHQHSRHCSLGSRVMATVYCMGASNPAFFT